MTKKDKSQEVFWVDARQLLPCLPGIVVGFWVMAYSLKQAPVKAGKLLAEKYGRTIFSPLLKAYPEKDAPRASKDSPWLGKARPAKETNFRSFIELSQPPSDRHN